MGRKKRNKNKNKNYTLSFTLNKDVLPSGGIRTLDFHNYIARKILKYLSGEGVRVLNDSELNSLINDISDKLLSSDDNEKLYKNLNVLLNFSLEDFKYNFIELIKSLYKNEMREDDLDKLIKMFCSGVGLYKPIITYGILHDERICNTVRYYIDKLISDANTLSRNLRNDFFDLYRCSEFDGNLIEESKNMLYVENFFRLEEIENTTSTDETLSDIIAKLDDEEFNKMANDIILDNKDEVILSDL